MSIIVRREDGLHSIERGSVLLNNGSFKSPEQGFVRKQDGWHPIWKSNESDSVNKSPLPPGVPRWGVAQFSDMDFTGGKSNPNMDGGDYDRWNGVQDFIDSELHSYNPSMTVSMSIPFPDYGYFAHKASDGKATFVDSVNGWPGGWDGATWEDGGFGATTGPVSVMYDDGSGVAEWLVYRTDFSGVGDLAWSVTVV